jgi:hypothetical protein
MGTRGGSRTGGVVRIPGVLGPSACARWVRAVYAARAEWTPCFEGVQFTLGRAYYTHLEEGREGEYFSRSVASDALVERTVPGLQDRVRTILARLVGPPVEPRPGWCGPGVHIFPAGEWLSRHGGDVHFDTEGLAGEDLEARRPALSVILMLQPPFRGGGLRVWEAEYDGQEDVPAPEHSPSEVVDYAAGDLVVIDSHRLHQIQPFEGNRDRISITAHLVLREQGWLCWF